MIHGVLFRWFDKLNYEKCVHPSTIDKIAKHHDGEVIRTLKAKIGNYNLIKTIALDTVVRLPMKKKTHVSPAAAPLAQMAYAGT